MKLRQAENGVMLRINGVAFHANVGQQFQVFYVLGKNATLFQHYTVCVAYILRLNLPVESLGRGRQILLSVCAGRNSECAGEPLTKVKFIIKTQGLSYRYDFHIRVIYQIFL